MIEFDSLLTHFPLDIVNLDCSGSPDNVWDQLLAIGRLMRPAAQHKLNEDRLDDRHNDEVPFVL